MKAGSSKTEVVVSDPDAALLLVNPRALRFLAPFMLAPQSLSSVAHTLGAAPSAVAYWIPRFLAARLIARTPPPEGEANRRGKWYRSVATTFLVPVELLPDDHDGWSIERGRRRAADRFYTALATAEPPQARWVSVSAVGDEVHLRGAVVDPAAAGRGQVATLDAWLEVDLTRAEATALKADLLRVLDTYRQRKRPARAAAHLVHVGITPVA